MLFGWIEREKLQKQLQLADERARMESAEKEQLRTDCIELNRKLTNWSSASIADLADPASAHYNANVRELKERLTATETLAEENADKAIVNMESGLAWNKRAVIAEAKLTATEQHWRETQEAMRAEGKRSAELYEKLAAAEKDEPVNNPHYQRACGIAAHWKAKFEAAEQSLSSALKHMRAMAGGLLLQRQCPTFSKDPEQLIEWVNSGLVNAITAAEG